VVVPAQPASSTSTVDSLTQLYKNDAPGIVDITVESSSGSSIPLPFGQPKQSQKQEAEGTGFEIDTNGNILTAEHVVDKADSVKVQFEGRLDSEGDGRRQRQVDRYSRDPRGRARVGAAPARARKLVVRPAGSERRGDR